MKCTVKGCPGTYSARLVIHTVRRGTEVLVFEDVPAEVCDICSDTLLAPETIRHIEKLIQTHTEPRSHAPVYAYC